MTNNHYLNDTENKTVENKVNLFEEDSIYLFILIVINFVSIVLIFVFIVIFIKKINNINRHVRTFYNTSSMDDLDSLQHDGPIVTSNSFALDNNITDSRV